MEHARKLVLLPRESLERMQQLLGNNGIKSVQTPGTTLDRLDAEMSDILTSSKSKKDDREKWDEYNRALQRYLHFNNSVTGRKLDDFVDDTPIKKVGEDFKKEEESFIVTAIPKTFKTTATNLIRHLKRCGGVTWNTKGAVAINGSVLHGANIIDLVGDAMRDRKREPPPGREQFAAALRDAHVPREFIGNKRLWEEITAATSSANSSTSETFSRGLADQQNFVSAAESRESTHASLHTSGEKLNLSRRQKKNLKRVQRKSLASTPKKSLSWKHLPETSK